MSATPQPQPALLELRNVTVRRGENTVLRSLSLRIGVGEHVAILGPNGCGKSTLVQTITCDLYPLVSKESSITIMGRDRWNVWELRSMLGVVSNDLMSTCARDITGRDVVLSGFFSSIGIWPNHVVTDAMRAKADEVLLFLDVPHLADRLVIEMSSGEAKRVLIGRALVHDPRALLFDEPSNSLDLHAQWELRELMRKLARAGIGIVLVTHHLSDIIPEIERVILMRRGGVKADGAKAEVLTAQSLSSLFDVPVELAVRDGYYHAW